ncbi:hypothetical protein Clacol_005100 [Clathrus columnatus]|uniref:Uncharacterized protein n=1 Tax=Clathrus columnatus TaxID=1419009 RepID=A0AAV5ABB6_9AGAM|nr:hypothetical protein Clacol_005100 [Clathrus columnatus]
MEIRRIDLPGKTPALRSENISNNPSDRSMLSAVSHVGHSSATTAVADFPVLVSRYLRSATICAQSL